MRVCCCCWFLSHDLITVLFIKRLLFLHSSSIHCRHKLFQDLCLIRVTTYFPQLVDMGRTASFLLVVFLFNSLALHSSSFLLHPSLLPRTPYLPTRSFDTSHNSKSSLTYGPIYKLCANRMIARSPLSLSSSSQTNESATTNKPSFSTILNSALLISGTTIGGGFLSLPTVTGPIGFVPSSLTLFVVWLYLLLQSFVLVEAIQLTWEDGLAKLQEAESLISTIDKNKISINNEKKQNITPGVASVGRHVFGRVGEVLIGILLTIIIEATLVSQISRAGLTLFNGQSYKIACAMSSISVALIVFGPKQGGLQFASKMNSLLTFGFLLSIFAVFTCGIPSADFRCLGLTSALGNIQRSNLSDAIPIFLQLLVYGEIIPSVCELLNYESKAIRTAIVSGSFLTLCLQISWSALGISLLSPSVGADIITNDVLNMLIQKGGALKVPLLSLATTAILTTILGSYVALQSMINNIYSKISNVPTSKMTSASSNSLRQRLVVGSIISIPALLIASTSPTIFLKAIDFAGSYPVLLLWGILPPVTVLTQRLRIYRRTGSTSKVSSSGSSFWLMFLSIISSVMVGMNAKDDILRLIQNHLI